MPLGDPNGSVQKALTPQWAEVVPFGLRSPYDIHFESGDLHGRTLGRAIGWDAWFKARSYIDPFSPGPI